MDFRVAAVGTLAVGVASVSSSAQLVQWENCTALRQNYLLAFPTCEARSETAASSSVNVSISVNLAGLHVSTTPGVNCAYPRGFARATGTIAGGTNWPFGYGPCPGSNAPECCLIPFGGSYTEADPLDSTVPACISFEGTIDRAADTVADGPTVPPFALTPSATGWILATLNPDYFAISCPPVRNCGGVPVPVARAAHNGSRVTVSSTQLDFTTGATIINGVAKRYWAGTGSRDERTQRAAYWLISQASADGRLELNLTGSPTAMDFMDITITVREQVGSSKCGSGDCGGSQQYVANPMAVATGHFVSIGLTHPTLGGNYSFGVSTANQSVTTSLPANWQSASPQDFDACPAHIRVLRYRIPLYEGLFGVSVAGEGLPLGDDNSDGVLTCADLAALQGLVATSGYSRRLDMNADGVLDAFDVALLGHSVSTCETDFASLGGSLVPDCQVTTDDLIAFLSLHAASDPRADIATLGGQRGPDGQVTADDLIYFLDRYSAESGGACPRP